METLSITAIIKDSPAPVAILDTNMRFMGHSDVWLETFAANTESIIGRSYYEVLPNSPDIFRKIHKDCLKGESNQNKGKKFIYPNGAVQWLKWKINNWKHENGQVGGLIILQEDITETKRLEELLQMAESVARIGGWEVDMATNAVYWTEVTKEIHEVPKDYIPSLDESINFYKAGKHREEITRLVSRAISEGTPWDTELIIVTAKDNELWVRAKGEAEIVDGKCVRIYGTFQDIDEKKRYALNLQEVKEKFAAVGLGAKFGVFDYNLVENILVWDDSMYPLYGIEKEDFGGEYEAWQACVHPDDLKRCENEINLAVSGEIEFDTKFRIIWPNGEIRHIGGIAVIHRDADGRALRMIGSNWDVTELKNAQLMLEKSEESFQGAFENSVIGMAMVNLKGQWIKANQSLCNSLGYTEDELKNLNIRDITHPEDIGNDLALHQELSDEKRDSYQMEKRYYHKKGHEVYVILTVTVVRGKDERISHFISQVMDISKQKKSEKKLKKLVNVTSEQNDSLLNFAHIVSHNLRSHSSNLSMLTGFLSTEEDSDEQKNLIHMLCEASESLNETILHLSEVVQVKVGALEKMNRVNLYRTIKNVEKNLSLLIQQKNAKCIFDIPKELEIRGIPAYLDSIFLNLITNGIKYSSPARPPIIKIKSRQIDDKIMMTFSDNGLGIDLDRHGDKLFGMYKTFHRNKDAKGIGLFITKNQIEAMNGKIEVESIVDAGTTFKLYFDKN